MITYYKGSLFEGALSFANSILAHACNCKGVWGSGIAVEFKERFPKVFNQYAYDCAVYGDKLSGTTRIYRASDKDDIACLFTSRDYGDKRDEPLRILRYTESAVADLVIYARMTNRSILMPKINSGRFAVPWEETENLLNTRFSRRNFNVWDGSV